jgi:uncharacterized membrane protein
MHPFRVAVLRGLGVALPPLLTIVIFLWIGGTIEQYVIVPLTNYTRNVWALAIADVKKGSEIPVDKRGDEEVVLEGVRYHRVSGGQARSVIVVDGVAYRPAEEVAQVADRDSTYVPRQVYAFVWEKLRGKDMPQTGMGIYQRYVEIKHLPTYRVVLVFVPLFVIVLYLLGKFMAARIGRMSWNLMERAIRRVPLVRNVYSPVKQVSDFLLNDRDIRASRVVAVEWPRKGVWALGLVTGESMQDIEAAANEPVLSVLVCTSPMPMTGFTVTVRKCETVDLSISIDQAFQFIISCGVAVPPQQVRQLQDSDGPAPSLIDGGDSNLAADSDQHMVGR